MALQKTVNQNNGVITTYHRIENVSLDHDRTLSGMLDSYVSKEYAVSFHNKIASDCFMFENASIEEEESMGIRQLAYTKIKQEDKWKDAVDC